MTQLRRATRSDWTFLIYLVQPHATSEGFEAKEGQERKAKGKIESYIRRRCRPGA